MPLPENYSIVRPLVVQNRRPLNMPFTKAQEESHVDMVYPTALTFAHVDSSSKVG